MILQIESKKISSDVNHNVYDFNIVAKWLNINQIKQNLSVDINCVVRSINTGFECEGYYWVELRR